MSLKLSSSSWFICHMPICRVQTKTRWKYSPTLKITANARHTGPNPKQSDSSVIWPQEMDQNDASSVTDKRLFAHVPLHQLFIHPVSIRVDVLLYSSVCWQTAANRDYYLLLLLLFFSWMLHILVYLIIIIWTKVPVMVTNPQISMQRNHFDLSALMRGSFPWKHQTACPFFHHICRPGSTRFDLAQRPGVARIVAFPPRLDYLLEGASQTSDAPVPIPPVTSNNHCLRNGSSN